MKRRLTYLFIVLMAIVMTAGSAWAADVEVVHRFYTGAGDGHVKMGGNSSWANAHNGVGEYAFGGDNSGFLVSYYTGSVYKLHRYLYPFYTADIPDSATINSASLNVYLHSGAVANADNDYVAIVKTYQASYTSLQASDFEDVGSDNDTAGRAKESGIVRGSANVLLSVFSSGQYNSIALNATGLAWIAKTNAQTSGYAPLGIRFGTDLDNSAPTGLNTLGGAIYNSEYSGTTNGPYLEVTYTCDENDAPSVDGTYVISVTATGGGGGGDPTCSITGDVIDIASMMDVNSSGYPETLTLGFDASSAPIVCVHDVNSGDFIKEISFFATGWTPKSVYVSDDMSNPADGINDISVMATEDSSGDAKAQIRDTSDGSLLKETDLP